jgi:O-acetyl-ADP-ribose deacetylase (regulator of RNase III)
MPGKMSIIAGDITTLEVDAIVNAANESLLGGGGVDGAIHRAAGPDLLAYCRTLGGCPTGEAKMTPGFRLPARWVIHTPGPIWQGGSQQEEKLLANCYRNSLALAEAQGVRTIAFPAISTGIFGFPLERAAEIAITETRRFLEGHALPEEVIFVCFSARAAQVYRETLERLAG